MIISNLGYVILAIGFILVLLGISLLILNPLSYKSLISVAVSIIGFVTISFAISGVADGELKEVDVLYGRVMTSESEFIPVDSVTLRYERGKVTIQNTDRDNIRNFQRYGIYLDGELEYPFIKAKDKEQFEEGIFNQFKKK